MASRGAAVAGTDGADFEHRQRVAAHYQASALNKSRLRYCVFFHCLLLLAMLAKLSADVLDRLDVFVLEIEELRVPKPLRWEYLWCGSALAAVAGLQAAKKNRADLMKRSLAGVCLLGLAPVLFCFVRYLPESYRYLSGDYSPVGAEDPQDELPDNAVFVWQGYPYGLLWHGFAALASQVHCFYLYFAINLMNAWKSRGTLSKRQ